MGDEGCAQFAWGDRKHLMPDASSRTRSHPGAPRGAPGLNHFVLLVQELLLRCPPRRINLLQQGGGGPCRG